MLINELLLLIGIPTLIFLARVIDVSLGTIRIIFISREWKMIAASLGFIEVLIWILAITQIMKNLDNFWAYFAYALGFACGTYVGMLIEEKIAVGTVMFQIITKKPAKKLLKELHQSDARLTSIRAKSDNGPVDILYVVTKRKKAHLTYKIINKYHPRAFLSIEDIRIVQESHFLIPPSKNMKKHQLGRQIQSGIIKKK